jgi:hypothetical protein
MNAGEALHGYIACRTRLISCPFFMAYDIGDDLAEILLLFLKSETNCHEADNMKCSYCHKTIEQSQRISNGSVRTTMPDRSNRVDCEDDDGNITTYHKECWFFAIFK